MNSVLSVVMYNQLCNADTAYVTNRKAYLGTILRYTEHYNNNKSAESDDLYPCF